MPAIALCVFCQVGQHENHVAERQGSLPGAMGGYQCNCGGECREPLQTSSEDFVLTPDAMDTESRQ